MDDGGHRGRAALGAGVGPRQGGDPGGPMDRHGAAEAVEPLLLVEDVVDLQRVGPVARVLGTDTKNVLGCRKRIRNEFSSTKYLLTLKINCVSTYYEA